MVPFLLIELNMLESEDALRISKCAWTDFLSSVTPCYFSVLVYFSYLIISL